MHWFVGLNQYLLVNPAYILQIVPLSLLKVSLLRYYFMGSPYH